MNLEQFKREVQKLMGDGVSDERYAEVLEYAADSGNFDDAFESGVNIGAKLGRYDLGVKILTLLEEGE